MNNKVTEVSPARVTLAERILKKFGKSRQPEETDSANPTNFRFIESEQELADVIDSSFRGTVPIFLHDPWCPISARAYRQMAKLGMDLPTVDVARQRGLSSEIERWTGVRHQSPQVIVLRDAVAIWDASHGRVTAEAVQKAIAKPAASDAKREAAGGHAR